MKSVSPQTMSLSAARTASGPELAQDALWRHRENAGVGSRGGKSGADEQVSPARCSQAETAASAEPAVSPGPHFGPHVQGLRAKGSVSLGPSRQPFPEGSEPRRAAGHDQHTFLYLPACLLEFPFRNSALVNYGEGVKALRRRKK